MTSKEDEFLQRLAGLLADIEMNRREDGEAVFHIGNLASRLIKEAKVRSWPQVKEALTREAFSSLLGTMQTQANTLHKQGKLKAAYAIEVLATSLIARTLPTPQIAEGDEILDDFIAAAIATYQKNKHLAPAGA